MWAMKGLRVLSFTGILFLGLLATSCRQHDGQEMTTPDEAYFDRVQRAFDTLARRLDRTDAEDSREGKEAFTDFVSSIRKLSPPERVGQSHVRLLAAAQSIQMAPDGADGDTLAQDLTAACLDLQKLADSENIAVTLPCE